MSQGLGQVQRKILQCLDADGGYVNTVRLASMVYGRRNPTMPNRTYTLYALRLLEQEHRVHGVKGRPWIWTTDAWVLADGVRKYREGKKESTRGKSIQGRSNLPGQMEFGDHTTSTLQAPDGWWRDAPGKRWGHTWWQKRWLSEWWRLSKMNQRNFEGTVCAGKIMEVGGGQKQLLPGGLRSYEKLPSR